MACSLRFGIRGRGPWWKVQKWRPWARWAVAGFLAGMSYLARPEGLAAVVILSLVLLLLAVGRRGENLQWFGWWQKRMGKMFPRRRLRGGYALAAIACLIGGAMIPAVPYMLVTHRFTGKVEVAAAADGVALAQAGARLAVVPTILRETAETFSWPAVVVLLGAVVLKPRLWGRARLRLPVMVWSGVWVFVMGALLLWPGKGYLDGRHTLPLQVLLFALLGVALIAWERPMRWWMNWWRRSPEKWRALPAWRRWSRWPVTAAVGVALVMLAPSIAALGLRPRADKGHFLEAAGWIGAHAAENVVVVDYQRLVGFYSGQPYAKWFGTPQKLELAQLDDIRRMNNGAPLLVGMSYESSPGAGAGAGMGTVPQLALGPYRAIAAFQSPVVHEKAALRRDVYVIYALPGERVLRDGTAEELTALPGLGAASRR